MENMDDIRTINWYFQHKITSNLQHITLHMHEYYELYCFLKGDVIYHVEGTSYRLQPYDILAIRPAESHSAELLSASPYERLCIHFSKDMLERIDKSEYLLSPFEKRNLGEFNLFRARDMKNNICECLVNHLLNEMPDIMPNREIHISTILLMLLNELSRTLDLFHNNNNTENTRLNQIIQYINDNICEKLTLDDICKQFYISKAQLLRVFKNNFGTTVHHYITIKRLTMAKQMLAFSNAPMKVFSSCGFSDYSIFYKAFKKHYGYPPSQPISTWKK